MNQRDSAATVDVKACGETDPGTLAVTMRRRLFNLCAMLALLLGASLCVLWIDQQWNGRWVTASWEVAGPASPRFPLPDNFVSYQRSVSIGSGDQGISLAWESSIASNRAPFTLVVGSSPVVPPHPALVAAGYDAYWVAKVGKRDGWLGTVYTLFVRPWLIAALLFILPVVWFRRWRTLKRRSSEGLCLSCGYDLRASPTRCPECGAEAAG